MRGIPAAARPAFPLGNPLGTVGHGEPATVLDARQNHACTPYPSFPTFSYQTAASRIEASASSKVE